MKSRVMMFRIAALIVVLLAAVLVAQQPRPVSPPTVPRTNTLPQPIELEKSDVPMTSPAKLLKYQHEETKRDVDKLVKLVSEVQGEVDKAGENVLPLNTLKKLEEVEKLSKKVRNRIKQ